MISDRGMAALRTAATLTHFLPGLGARVRHGREVVLAVRPSSPGAEPTHGTWVDGDRLVVSPSGFRCSVGRAHRRRVEGEHLSFLGLEAGCEPVVDIGVPAHGEGRPGGLFRVPLDGRWLWATATTLDAGTAYRLGADIVEESLPVEGIRALGIRPDPATDVNVVYAETTAAPGSAAEAGVLELFEALVARWSVHSLLESISGPQPVPEPRSR